MFWFNRSCIIFYRHTTDIRLLEATMIQGKWLVLLVDRTCILIKK